MRRKITRAKKRPDLRLIKVPVFTNRINAAQSLSLFFRHEPGKSFILVHIGQTGIDRQARLQNCPVQFFLLFFPRLPVVLHQQRFRPQKADSPRTIFLCAERAAPSGYVRCKKRLWLCLALFALFGTGRLYIWGPYHNMLLFRIE